MKNINKKYILLLVFIIYSIIGITQQKVKKILIFDTQLHQSIIGTWKHDISTYPSGNQEFYNREFTMYQDSTWSKREISRKDTSVMQGYWYIKDTCVYLYSIIPYGINYKDTSILLGDVVYIDHLSDTNMFLTRIWGEDSLKKTSLYKRIN